MTASQCFIKNVLSKMFWTKTIGTNSKGVKSSAEHDLLWFIYRKSPFICTSLGFLRQSRLVIILETALLWLWFFFCGVKFLVKSSCSFQMREVLLFYCQNEPYNGPFIEIDQQSSLNYSQSDKYRRRKVKIPPGSIKKIGKTKKLSNSEPEHGLDVSTSFVFFAFFCIENFGKNCVVSKCACCIDESL